MFGPDVPEPGEKSMPSDFIQMSIYHDVDAITGSFFIRAV
jgi:hypothetical protein